MTSFLQERISKAVDTLKLGKPILMLDADDRENEGDLVLAAELINPETMNFLIKKGSGVVCLSLPPERLELLGIPMMIPHNTNVFQTAFTVSIEASEGVTTGVSAKDRTHTVKTAMADNAKPTDLARPGHLFPLAARKNGVFERMGHTEGSVDLMKIAGLKQGAVLCELMNDDGSMTIGAARQAFADEYKIPVVSVDDILFYRMKNEDIFLKKDNFNCPGSFGSLEMQRLTLFDGQSLSFFKRSVEPLGKELSLEIAIIDDSLTRYVTQVLSKTCDDPLSAALTALETKKADMVVLFSKNTDSSLNAAEAEKRAFAACCRHLCDEGFEKLRLNQKCAEFILIAKNFFNVID
jgi:3,4-dihydroxy-2-butanone 4-phosphate synthase